MKHRFVIRALTFVILGLSLGMTQALAQNQDQITDLHAAFQHLETPAIDQVVIKWRTKTALRPDLQAYFLNTSEANPIPLSVLPSYQSVPQYNGPVPDYYQWEADFKYGGDTSAHLRDSDVGGAFAAFLLVTVIPQGSPGGAAVAGSSTVTTTKNSTNQLQIDLNDVKRYFGALATIRQYHPPPVSTKPTLNRLAVVRKTNSIEARFSTDSPSKFKITAYTDYGTPQQQVGNNNSAKIVSKYPGADAILEATGLNPGTQYTVVVDEVPDNTPGATRAAAQLIISQSDSGTALSTLSQPTLPSLALDVSKRIVERNAITLPIRYSNTARVRVTAWQLEGNPKIPGAVVLAPRVIALSTPYSPTDTGSQSDKLRVSISLLPDTSYRIEVVPLASTEFGDSVFGSAQSTDFDAPPAILSNAVTVSFIQGGIKLSEDTGTVPVRMTVSMDGGPQGLVNNDKPEITILNDQLPPNPPGGQVKFTIKLEATDGSGLNQTKKVTINAEVPKNADTAKVQQYSAKLMTALGETLPKNADKGGTSFKANLKSGFGIALKLFLSTLIP